VDPAAGATILSANVRPYRETAAAASNQNGRGIKHERGYKAAPARRQDGTRHSGMVRQHQTRNLSNNLWIPGSR
jgi:hypothetical protein